MQNSTFPGWASRREAAGSLSRQGGGPAGDGTRNPLTSKLPRRGHSWSKDIQASRLCLSSKGDPTQDGGMGQVTLRAVSTPRTLDPPSGFRANLVMTLIRWGGMLQGQRRPLSSLWLHPEPGCGASLELGWGRRPCLRAKVEERG